MANQQTLQTLQSASIRPLCAFPGEYTGQSNGIADLPEAWNILIGPIIPNRLSFNPQMMVDLARNFRQFLGDDHPFPLDANLDNYFMHCNGPWEPYLRDMLIGPPGSHITESTISHLHSLSVKIIVPTIFHYLRTNHPHCQILRDRDITVSVSNYQDPRGGVADNCFCLNVPKTEDEEKRVIDCFWFDDKNPAILENHKPGVEEMVMGGARLKWQQKNKLDMRLLVKVRPCLAFKIASSRLLAS
jgi:hypothetical protein